MYAGQIVEVGDAARFFTAPLHPYSQKLMASVPRLRADQEPDFITGQPPSLLNIPPGCRFADRCDFRFDRCAQDPPIFMQAGRIIRCWRYA
jgi:oligopeptide/dipeptide ABC transporter ATP-binding protein